MQGSSIMLAARNEAALNRIANDLRTRTKWRLAHAFDALDMEKHEAFIRACRNDRMG